jgi:hypothetical protein
MKLTEELAFIGKHIMSEDSIISFTACDRTYVKIGTRVYSDELFTNPLTWTLIGAYQDSMDRDIDKVATQIESTREILEDAKFWFTVTTAEINTINLNGNLCGIQGYDWEVSLNQLTEEADRFRKSNITSFTMRINSKKGLLAFVSDITGTPISIIGLYSVQKSLL